MRTNTKAKTRSNLHTHEGAPAKNIHAEQLLRRSVMSCLLWEDEFYEDGQTIAQRITETAEQVRLDKVAAIAVEARHQFNLRHVPLLLLLSLVRRGSGQSFVSDTIAKVITRADELAEFVALYWKDGRKPLSAQMKKGLAKAFRKFDAYQLAKYDRNGAVKLRDVLFMVHAKPEHSQVETFKGLADKTLASPDTWEVGLSGGADKKETFERLLREGKLGYLALLRNLRNMVQAGCDDALIRDAILARKGAERVLPFRYVAAARACVQLEPVIDEALCEAIAELPVLAGKTVVLIDVSRSMDYKFSIHSDMTRMDAAATLGAIMHGDLRVFTFSNKLIEVPPRRGMAGVDSIRNSQDHGGTYLGRALAEIHAKVAHDRIIVITDEQSHDRVPDPIAKHAYMVNIASARNGVGYGRWTHVDGFSEQILRFIVERENID